MQSLSQSARRRASSGRLLPDISPVLTARGVRVRQGQVLMLAAQPNGGKSMFALWYAVTHNLPTLYISADTDAADTLYRALAMLTGDKVGDIEEAYELGADEAYAPELQRVSNIRFTFESTPTLEDIGLEVEAFEELWGRPPQVLVIDNLLNIVHGETSGNWGTMLEISSFLHDVARKSGAAVMVLHHTSEAEGKAAFPPPRKAVIGKVSQLPEVILTTALVPNEGVFRIACVKNRSGTHDPSGKSYAEMFAIPERMQLYDNQADAQMARDRYAFA